MALPGPNLDDRSFDDLMAEALAHVRASPSGWTDLSPHDPGVVLLEVMAHLAEMLIYRTNRMTEKVQVALLNLIGVQLHPPSAAVVPLTFTLARPAMADLHLPAGIRVATRREGQADPVQFEVLVPGLIPAGQTAMTLPAAHCIGQVAELLGTSGGQAGQQFRLAHGPVVAPNHPGVNLILAVAADPHAPATDRPTLSHGGQSFVIWDEVPRFGPATAGLPVYTIDRAAGTVSFAPALRLPDGAGGLPALAVPAALVPPAGAEIRVWYKGAAPGNGNLRAGLLSVLTPAIDGLSVSNAADATGGRALESVANAILRGPAALHSLERAITARDFEALAQAASGGVNRARAMADAALWVHGVPGRVTLTLLPQPTDPAAPITAQSLQAAASDALRAQVAAVIDQRRALGTDCRIDWGRAKTVSVQADVRAYPGQEARALQARLTERLDRLICPVDLGPGRPGWTFGRPLLDWDVLRAIADQPGVATVSNVRLIAEKAPSGEVSDLARDAWQPQTWYTVSGEDLYRTGNDGQSWEAVVRFPGEAAVLVESWRTETAEDTGRAGMVAVLTRAADGTRVYLSRDCGETVAQISLFQFEVTGLAWVMRGPQPALLLASPTGLFELDLRPDAAPRAVLFDLGQPELGATSVAVSADPQGRAAVAVAGSGETGVYLSALAGQDGSFAPAGLKGQLVRALMVQHTATQRFLWAGTSAPGTEGGNGVFRLRLEAQGGDRDAWSPFAQGWSAGSCRTLAHDGKTIYAGSLRRGVLTLDPDAAAPGWREPDVGCGLPLRDVGRLHPINTLAAGPGLVMSGGPTGIYASTNQGGAYRLVSSATFGTELKLPPTWVFCSGNHRITVRAADDPG